jgi:D-3-phosphoglycerate dehydrogenase
LINWPYSADKQKGTPKHMSDRPRAFVTAAVRGPGLELLHQLADLTIDGWLDQPQLRILNPEQLAQRLEETNANLVIVEADQCSGPVFERHLIAVASARGDPNNVNVAEATAAGIPVLRAPARNADAVAEITIALLFACTRGLVAADHDVRVGEIYKDGTIPYQRFRAWELNGRTVGLVGLGAVGRATRWRLEGLGMKTLAHDPYANEHTVSLDELFERCDIISMHAPVTPETTGMIGAAEFAKMRDGVVYINSARAKLHDHQALIAALQSGKVSSAGLDHFEGEFLDPADPLAHMSNVVLAPHIGGATYDTETNHTNTIANDLCRLLAGARPINCVNPEVLK